MPLTVSRRDFAALREAHAALLDVDASAPATADRLVAALGPAFSVDSAWGIEAPLPAPGAAGHGARVAPAPYADRAGADFVEALARLADLRPDAVTLRERAAADAALRVVAGAVQRTWHLEELPRRLGEETHRAFRHTALYQALFAPGRTASATGFVTAGPDPASLVLSWREPDRPARRARARLLLATLAPAVHARHAVRARLARAAVASGWAPAAPPSGGAPLTPRERQVAALLADRRTNAEVAEALGVSVHTVRRHVERVLHKLGARSRNQVRGRVRGDG